MYTAAYGNDGPFVIRYPRGEGVLKDWQNEMKILEIGKGRKLKDGDELAVLSIGPIGNVVSSAIAKAEKEGHKIAHYDMIFLKPIDTDILDEVAKNYSTIITVENGVISGGLGSAVIEYFSEKEYKTDVIRVGLPDEFVEHGSLKDLNHAYEIDEEGILKKINTAIKIKKTNFSFL